MRRIREAFDQDLDERRDSETDPSSSETAKTWMVASGAAQLSVRVADDRDVGAVASLRSLWTGGESPDASFERRMAGWLESEGDRRTIWLASLGGVPVGMASLFEYRRMPRPRQPDSRWGYVGNVFVRETARNRGVGSAMLAALVTTADERQYARLVVSPSQQAVAFYERAGFVPADGRTPSADRLLVRSSRS